MEFLNLPSVTERRKSFELSFYGRSEKPLRNEDSSRGFENSGFAIGINENMETRVLVVFDQSINNSASFHFGEFLH